MSEISRPGIAVAERRRISVTTALPLLVAVGVITLLFVRYPPGDIVAQVSGDALLRMLPAAVVAPILYIIVHPGLDCWMLRRAGLPIPYLAMVRAKAAISVLTLVAHAVSSGGYTIWLARRTGMSATTAATVGTLLILADLAAVAAIALAAVLSFESELRPVLAPITAAIVAGWLLLNWTLRRAALRRPPKSPALKPVAALPLPLLLAQLLGRAISIGLGMVLMWLGARAFGLELPASAAAAYLPVLLLVHSLPVNVAGFGASQAAWVVAFSAYETPERILAFQLVWQLIVNVVVIARGLPFLRRITREFAGGAAR